MPLRGLAAAFGLSALLLASQVAYDVIRIVGAAVLVWMGARALWQRLVTNFANPKAGVFALSFLP